MTSITFDDKTAKSLCTADEFKLHPKAQPQKLEPLKANQLQDLVSRSREARNQWRDVSRQSRSTYRAARAAPLPMEAELRKQSGSWVLFFLPVVLLGLLCSSALCLPLHQDPDPAVGAPIESTAPAAETTEKKVRRIGVLSNAEVPGRNTSQGLFIKILNDAGMEARRVSAEEIRQGVLDELDIFIIGGGSGTRFNASLGADGGKNVEEFVRNGGGVIGSCAGGYSFVLGHNEALKYIEIANARCIDTENQRWARGSAVVEIEPEGKNAPHIKMRYANGPLWEITQEPRLDRCVALARFVSDVKKGDDPGGIMPGTPAILAGTFGKGRFVLFSAHPEFNRALGNNPMVVDAARWVTGGPIADDSAITWSDVFPSKMPAEENAPSEENAPTK